MTTFETARVVSVSVSSGGIPKRPISAGVVTQDGILGDGRAHAKHIRPERAISLWDMEILLALVAEGYDLFPGAAGENLTVEGLGVQRMAPGTRLEVGDVVLRLTEPRKPCYVLDAIDPQLKDVVLGRIGYLAAVEAEGVVRPGDPIRQIEPTLNLSDDAISLYAANGGIALAQAATPG